MQILAVVTEMSHQVEAMADSLRNLEAGQVRIEETQTHHTEKLDGLEEHLSKQDVVLLKIAGDTKPPSPNPATQVVFTVVIDGETQTGVSTVEIAIGKQFTVTPAFKDDEGNIAPVDGVPEWKNDNESVLLMEVAEDGLSAIVASAFGAGSGQISCAADADLGQGTRPIVGTLLVNVLPKEATVVEMNPGPVEDYKQVTPSKKKH